MTISAQKCISHKKIIPFHFSYISFSHACVLSHFGHVQHFATPWTVALQASLSMGFSRQEYWSGLLCLPPGDLPDTGIELVSLRSPALASGFFTISATWEAPKHPPPLGTTDLIPFSMSLGLLSFVF